jgi:putative ABC transport system permease protein
VRARRWEFQVWLENVRVGVDALRVHPLRTALSVLGILIGSAALIATMAVSDGMMSFARDQVLRNTSVLVVTLSPRTSKYQDGEWVANHDYPIFTPADAAALRDWIPEVESVALTLGGRADVGARGVRCRASVVLGTAGLTEFQTLDLAAGRFFSDGEVAHGSGVVVVNYALATELSRTRNPLTLVGRDIRVNGRSCRVIGVHAPTGFEDRREPDFTLYAPIRSASALLPPPARGRFAPSIQLRATRVESVDRVRDAVADWLSRRHVRWEEQVRVVVAVEELKQIEQAFLLMKLFIGALVGISLLVGGIGIMNVLLAAVAERTREIGIRKSVGARAADIHAQFLAESVAIALTGATAGLLIGFTMALGITGLFRHLLGVPVHAALSPGSVLIATLSSSVTGLVFGTYPARRASRLAPIAALAHEA